MRTYVVCTPWLPPGVEAAAGVLLLRKKLVHGDAKLISRRQHAEAGFLVQKHRARLKIHIVNPEP